MLSINYQMRAIEKLNRVFGGNGKKVRQQVAIAINEAIRDVKKEANKRVRQELAVTAKTVNRVLDPGRKANPDHLRAVFTIKAVGANETDKTGRLALRDFGARQVKKGVSYKISKSQGRKMVASAFQGPTPSIRKTSWRGRVFLRTGTTKTPIRQLYGPSPWGVMMKSKRYKGLQNYADKRLKYRIDRRVRFNVLKAAGKI